MARALEVGILFLFAANAAEAANTFRANNARPHLQSILGVASHQAGQQAPEVPGFAWGSLSMGIGFGILAVAVIGGIAFFVLKGRGSEKQEEKEGLLAEAAEAGELNKPESMGKDYSKLIKILAQKVAQEAGPKLSKAGAVKNVIDSRMASFQDKAKSFLLNEMNSTAAEVLTKLDAPEAMMLLHADSAVEANFPPASILVAGVLSPTIISLMSIHHLVQMLIVGLPILILCCCAIYIDWAAPCAIPSIFEWLFTQTALAFLLVIGHGALFIKTQTGKARLAAKAEEVHSKHNKDDGSIHLQDEFVDNTIILQEALVVENDIRLSFWNGIVGAATLAWVVTTLWNLFLIARYTFVPGIIAFHPKAHKVDDFCGAWMTVLVLRINIMLAVLFLFFNLATVVKWICDMMIESKPFQQSVIKQAQDMDRQGAGLPVMELLVKAFLLRGGSDTLDSRLAVVQNAKREAEYEQASVAAQLAALQAEIDSTVAAEDQFKSEAREKGGDIAQTVDNLGNTGDLALWKAQGPEVLAQKAQEMREETTKALEELWEAIQKAVAEARNSEAAKAMQAKYQQAQAMVQENFDKAMATLQDEEFQKQLMEAAKNATDQAQQLTKDAMEYATDPAKQEELQKAMKEAMEKAQKAAQEVAEAANDPEKRRQLQEQAEKAMKQAQAAAEEAAAGLNSEEMQQKLKEAAQNALDQAQLAAQSAIAAAQDPELLKKMQESAEQAMADAKKQLDEAANNPELKAAAEKAMEDAKRLTDQAKAAAQDVDQDVQKKLAEAAQKYQELKK